LSIPPEDKKHEGPVVTCAGCSESRHNPPFDELRGPPSAGPPREREQRKQYCQRRMRWVGDPEFVNAASGDFHLRSTSPAVDRGETLGAPFDSDIDAWRGPQGPHTTSELASIIENRSWDPPTRGL